jgi:hypothetical protein
MADLSVASSAAAAARSSSMPRAVSFGKRAFVRLPLNVYLLGPIRIVHRLQRVAQRGKPLVVGRGCWIPDRAAPIARAKCVMACIRRIRGTDGKSGRFPYAAFSA